MYLQTKQRSKPLQIEYKNKSILLLNCTYAVVFTVEPNKKNMADSTYIIELNYHTTECQISNVPCKLNCICAY